jgi:hypothetical protein
MARHSTLLIGWRPTAPNMKLEDQIVSPQLAKRLKELGLEQESCYFWRLFKGTREEPLLVDGPSIPLDRETRHFQFISAFTVAELGVMLPTDYSTTPGILPEGKFWFGYKASGDTRQLIPGITSETEAESRAKMLIYLLENKLTAL